MTTLEENAVVLDFLPVGKSTDMTKEPLAQLLGESYFTLLEAVPKPGISLALGERVYVGKDNRDKVDHIKGRILYDQLTNASRNELKNAISQIIKMREADFVGFFNRSGAITMRLNQLELLPGIGKKHMQDILSEREKKPFESLADMGKRVSLLPDPVHLIEMRIEQELHGNEKYYLFARPPPQPHEYGHGFGHRRYP